MLSRTLLLLTLLPSLLCSQIDSVRTMRQAWVDVNLLASDSLDGRGYVNQGHLMAADYIAKRFDAIGLKPLAAEPENKDRLYQPSAHDGFQIEHAAFLQPFQFPLNLIEDAGLMIDKKNLAAGTDFIPAAYTAAAQGNYPLIYIGNGLPNDYPDREHQGAFVMMKHDLPKGVELPDSLELLRQAYHRTELAKLAGAAGVIFIMDKLTHSYRATDVGLPVLFVKREAIESPGHYAHGRHSVKIGLMASQQQQKAYNVVGWIPGKSSDQGAVVITAHYDHLGSIGDAKFVGANDNASGVAFLLGLAEQIQSRGPYAVPVIFIACGGEEAGLHGSQHYALKDPLYPLEMSSVCLNFDLLGYGSDGVMVVGGKQWKAKYKQLVTIAEQQGGHFAFKARPNAPNSDHYPFTLQGVPGLFFYAMGGKPWYHDVYDRPDQLTLHVYWHLQQVILSYIGEHSRSYD